MSSVSVNSKTVSNYSMKLALKMDLSMESYVKEYNESSVKETIPVLTQKGEPCINSDIKVPH